MNAKKITTEEELHTAFAIRKKVFVEEQGVPIEEELDQFDTLDSSCDHILVYFNGEPVGTGRVRLVDGYGKLERICILPKYRLLGIGKVIMRKLEELAKEKGVTKSKLHAQTNVEIFYRRLGYMRFGEEFMDAGIPHILMKKKFS